MVVNRSDVKKKRKEIGAMDGAVEEGPKRTKVHAQRKFAQGSSNLGSVALTPIKDKDKLKSNGSILSSELIPLKRPKTEDFLTFLCFRGSSILPPQLNFFNVATFQDIQDEESSMSARDRSPNSSVDLTSVGNKLQKMMDLGEISSVVVNDDKKRDATKRRATAVQAIRKKYQEQRLAKQRANTLSKVTQKVNVKTMISTRSSAIREEHRPSLPLFQSKNSVSQKCPLKELKMPKPMETLNLIPLRKRATVIRRPKCQDFQCSTARRCGLRSSAISPFRNGAVENELVSSGRAAKSIPSESKTFVSSVSDFSSDDDQPLVKTKLTPQVHHKEFSRKVIKRITSRSSQIQTHILTRSRVQQQHGQQQLSQQQMWPANEVGYRQQHRDQVRHHHLHYLYSHRRLENSSAKLPVHVQLKRLPSLSPQQMIPQQIATRFSSRSGRKTKESSNVCVELLKKQHDSDGIIGVCSGEKKKIDTKIVGSKDDIRQESNSSESQKRFIDQKRRGQNSRLYRNHDLYKGQKRYNDNVEDVEKQKKPVVLLNRSRKEVKKIESSALKNVKCDKSSIKTSLRARTNVKERLSDNSGMGKQNEDIICKHKDNSHWSNDLDRLRISKDKKSLRSREGPLYTPAKSSLRIHKRNSMGNINEIEPVSNEEKNKGTSSIKKIVSGCGHQLRSKRLQKASNVMEVCKKSKLPHRRSLRHNVPKIVESPTVLSSASNTSSKQQRLSSGKCSTWRDKTIKSRKLVSSTIECKFSDSDEEPLKKIASKSGTNKKLTLSTKQNKDKVPLKNTLLPSSAKITKTGQNFSKFKEKYRAITKVTRANSSLVDNLPMNCPGKIKMSEEVTIKKKRILCSRTARDSKDDTQKCFMTRDSKPIEKLSNLQCNDNINASSTFMFEDASKTKLAANRKMRVTKKCPKIAENISKAFVPESSFLRSVSGRRQVTEKKIVNSSSTADLSANCRRRKILQDVPQKTCATSSVQDKKNSQYKLGKDISNSSERENCKSSELFSSGGSHPSELISSNTCDQSVCDNFCVSVEMTETKEIISAESFLSQYNHSSYEKGVLKPHLYDGNTGECTVNISKKELRKECPKNCPNNLNTELESILHIEEGTCSIDLKTCEEDVHIKESSNRSVEKYEIKFNAVLNLPKDQEIHSANNIIRDTSNGNVSSMANICFTQETNSTVNKFFPEVNLSSEICSGKDVTFSKDVRNSNVECGHASKMNASNGMRCPTNSQSNNSLLKSQFHFKENQVHGTISDNCDSKLLSSDSTVDGVCKKNIDNENKIDDKAPVATVECNDGNCDKKHSLGSSSRRKSDKYIFEYFNSECFNEVPSIDKVNVKLRDEKHYPGSDESSIESPESRQVHSVHLPQGNATAIVENKGNKNLNELNAVLIDIEKEFVAPNSVLPPDLGLQDFQVKEKLNMSAERVEKWLSESCSGNLTHKKDCTLFEKNICNCGYSVSDDDMCFPYGNDKFSVGDDSRECDDDVGLKSTFIFGDVQECDTSRKSNADSGETSKLNNKKNIDKDEKKSKTDCFGNGVTLQSNFKKHPVKEDNAVNSFEPVPENLACIQFSLMQNKEANSNTDALTIEAPHKNEDMLLQSPSRALSAVYVSHSSFSGPTSSKSLKVSTEETGKETESSPGQASSKQENNINPSPNMSSRQIGVGRLNIRAKKASKSSLHVNIGAGTKSNSERFSEKKSIFQNRRPFPMKIKERKDYTPSANAFSPENESSVYAFETESEVSPSTPFRRHTRDSRTSSSTTSKSEEDIVKFVDEDTSCGESNVHVPKCPSPRKKYMSTRSSSINSESKIVSCVSDVMTVCTRSSTSIAVQVNLDSEACSDSSSHCIISNDTILTEPLTQKSMECSTQTECAEDEDESEGHLFYIPIQNAPTPSQQLIRGVAVKLGTEGPTGPNQRVIMRAKFITKAPAFSAGTSEQEEPARSTNGSEIQYSTVSLTPKSFSANVSCDTTNGSGTCSKISTSPTVNATHSTNVVCAKTTHVDSRDHKNVAFEKVQKCSGSGLSNAIPSIAGTRNTEEAKSPTDQEAHPCKDNSGCAKRSFFKGKICKSSDTKYSFFPTNVSIFPSVNSPGQLVEAPVFYPSDKEFQDPLEYIDKIRPLAETFGLCRIVPPPNFKPECKVSDDMRFTAYNQYVHKMLHRWGPNAKEMMAIKKYLITQSIPFVHPPLIGGMEVDLPRLYQTVQSFGGLKRVIEKKRWHKVADTMKIPKSAQDRVAKLDDIYCKYLLPYETLSPDERQKLIDNVEEMWQLRQKKPLSQDSSTSSDNQDDEIDITDEECIVKGRSMPLNAFYRIARNTMAMWFRLPEPSSSEVEQEFWNHVMSRTCHVCVHTGSIDSSGCGYGFPCVKNSPLARHPWNLKVLTNNSGSILRSMGPIMGVTVPTLHVGMLFSTCCWYRDPHGLPWIEYLHTGAKKIWYGIPDSFSYLFRSAMNDMIPRYCKSKTIWLPSDTAMVPPSLLVKHGVSLCHTVQEPGQFIVVFPRAFTSSICTGYLVSESVYFAQPRWLLRAEEVFKDIRDSCEPSVFSLERLLISIAADPRSQVDVLKQVLPMILSIRDREVEQREVLHTLGLKTSERLPLPEANVKRRRIRHAQEEEGDYECEICRANLFVSLVINSQEEGVYCLEHAIELLTKKRNHLKYCKLLYTYDQGELKELITKLQDKIDMKSQKKSSQGKHNVASQK